MPQSRYFLHIRDNDRFIEDPEGVIAAGIEEARLEALRAAAELKAEGLLDGELTEDRRFELTDEQGELKAILPFERLLNSAIS